MNNNYSSNCLDIPTCSDFQNIENENSFNYSNSEEDFQIEDAEILEYNEVYEKLGFDSIKNGDKIEIFTEDLINGCNFIKSKSEQKSNISDSENENNTYIKNKNPKSTKEKVEDLEKNNDIIENNQPKQNEIDINENNLINNSKGNKVGRKKSDKKIKIKRKYKANIIRHKGKKKKLIKEIKKNKFIPLKLFNPKGEDEECKKIRQEINKIISENKSISEPLEKKSLKKKIFLIENEENIEKSKIIKKRKENPDNIRKKVKQKFLKSLKNKINIKLNFEKSEYLFDFFPQVFIANINRQKNKTIINNKLIELLNTNFFAEYENENLIKDKELDNFLKKKKINEKKYDHNLKVIEYLEKNENIKKKINFDYIKGMTFGELFKEYLESREFEKDILKLKQKENPEYIKNYINNFVIFIFFFFFFFINNYLLIKAYTFIKYFSE